MSREEFILDTTLPERLHRMELDSIDRTLVHLIRTVPPLNGQANWTDISPIAWDLVIQRAKRTGLAPLVYVALKKRGLQNRLSTDALENLRLDYFVAVARAEVKRRELAIVLQVLTAHQVIPVVFKGAALAHLVYPDPACRSMGDVDLWIRREEMLPAIAALESIGYVQHEKPTRPRALQMRNGGEVQMLGTSAKPGFVELHLGIFPGEWVRRTAQPDESAVRERVEQAILADQQALVLSAEDAVIQLAVHFAVSHQLGSFGLRALVDILLVAETQPVNWEVIVLRAREWRVATVTWLVLKLAVELVGLEEAALAITSLQPSRLRSFLISPFANAGAILEERDLSRSPIRLAYLILLVDRLRDVFQLVGRSIWPENSWLVARYGQSGWRNRFSHLVGAIQGQF